MTDCTNYRTEQHVAACQLIVGKWFPQLGQAGNPCGMCNRNWPGGLQPQSVDDLPLFLVAIANAKTPKELPERMPIPKSEIAQKFRTKPIPCNCDHAGRVLKPAARCCDRLYACDIHGEATCQTCAGCPDFVAIQS